MKKYICPNCKEKMAIGMFVRFMIWIGFYVRWQCRECKKWDTGEKRIEL